MVNNEYDGLIFAPKVRSSKSDFDLLHTKVKELFGELTSEIMIDHLGSFTFTVIFDSPNLKNDQLVIAQELVKKDSNNEFHYIFFNEDKELSETNLVQGAVHFQKQGKQWFMCEYEDGDVSRTDAESSTMLKMYIAEINNRGYNIKNLLISSKQYYIEKQTSK